ncbi:uncharacterized protein LOC134247357 [Saccostrea cucullata]|uniref:uncharacterized protein LOC134247357 n=1 Tax=Saccostrea cuccullata TaxID=36930 RepID=UPI002ED6C1B2
MEFYVASENDSTMKWWTFIAVLVITISLVNTRGGRGGFSGGRSGGRGGSSGFRSSFSGRRLSSSSSIRTALRQGRVYGATRYRIRNSYRAQGTLPKVCYNDKYDKSPNGSVSYKGRFFCPLDETMSDDYRYCCGEEGLQYCCTSRNERSIIALVIGILFAANALYLGASYMMKRLKSMDYRVRRNPITIRGSNTSFSISHETSPIYFLPSYEMTNTDEELWPLPPSPIQNSHTQN